MASGLACRICSGDVTLRIRGRGEPLTAAALSPSAHATGRHGDLFECRECGTVQQPVAPAGAALHDLYRDMTDEAYLGEEAGRRATSAPAARPRRAARARAGGCSTSAAAPACCSTRRAGAATRRPASSSRARRRRTPATRSASTCASSRSRTSPTTRRLRRRRARRRHRAPRRPGRRHRPLRRAARARRRALRRHAGPVVGDGARRRPALVGLCPGAHVPAAARDAARAARRAPASSSSTDVPLVRTFSARRWVEGLAERLGPAERAGRRRRPAPAGERARSACRSATSASCSPTASRCSAAGAARPRPAAGRSGARRPARLPRRRARSPTSSRDAGGRGRPRAARRRRQRRRHHGAALAHGLEVLRHPANRGYGAGQKTGYARALIDGADAIVMVHADNQYDPALVGEMVAPILAGRGRHGHRLAPARGPRDRRRHAAVEVAGQPAAHRDREPRVRRLVLRVPHGLPRVLRAACCARSRSCATPTSSSSTSRSSPR